MHADSWMSFSRALKVIADATENEAAALSRPRTLEIDEETPDDGSAIPIPREQDDPAYIPGYPVLVRQVADESDSAVGGSTYGSTYFADMQKCLRKHILRNHLGLVLNTDPLYRMQGTLIHRALAHHFIDLGVARGSMKPPRWHLGSRSELRAELLRISSGFPPKHVDACMLVMDSYAAQHKNDDILPRSVEQTYRVRLDDLESPEEAAERLQRALTPAEIVVGNWWLTIRPDLVFEEARAPGILFPTDHKTERHPYARVGQTPKLPEWDGDGPHALSFQQMVYARVLRAIFGATKVSTPVIQRVTRAEGSTMPLFERHPLKATMESLQYDSIATEIRQFSAHALVGYQRYHATRKLPVGNSTACKNRGFPCDMMNICLSRDPEKRAKVIETKYIRLSTPPAQVGMTDPPPDVLRKSGTPSAK